MRGEEEIAATSSFCCTQMAVRQARGYGYEIIMFDGCGHYVLWERQVKGMLKSMGLGMLLREKPYTLSDNEWKDLQEQVVYIVLEYLQPAVLKQVEK